VQVGDTGVEEDKRKEGRKTWSGAMKRKRSGVGGGGGGGNPRDRWKNSGSGAQ
jgi:hypothetical protein